MKKITRKNIITYRKMAAYPWHNTVWHEYMDTPIAEAIGWAEQNITDPYRSYADIQAAAEIYLTNN